LHELDLLKRSPHFAAELIEHTTLFFRRRLQILEEDPGSNALSPLLNQERRARELTKKVLQVERNELEQLRHSATIHDDVFFQLSRELDIEETYLRVHRV
jgi:hypothetical protein